jgi:subtilisin family serine protease
MEKEYIVTLKDFNESDQFYNDMETSGGTSTIPDRVVNCCCRRTISRNTHYMLTDEEAQQIKSDGRVIDCEQPPEKLGIEPIEYWDAAQDGDWDKVPNANTDKNWALKRCIDAQQTAGWGDNGTSQITGSVDTTSSGYNVDVVICDRHINFGHPEFRENPDGTGNLRTNEFNWFQYSSALGYSTNANYSYAGDNGSHGTHVAGTVAGNTQGWARNATIYNMEFASDAGGGNGVTSWTNKLWDYVRYFHKNKSINAATGRRNPTVMNNSWGYSYGSNSGDLSNTTSVNYRGTSTNLTGTDADKKLVLETKRVPVPGNTYFYLMPARVASVDADIQDAIDDGVIVVAAAGNSYWPMDVSGGADYDNTVTISSSNKDVGKGSTPGSADNVICVGSLGTDTADYKSDFSNFEERIDIWAPGSNIMSSLKNSSSGYSNTYTDPRDSSYYIGSISGTSMASPQICGLLACAVEQWPNMTPSEALEFLKESSKVQVGTQGSVVTSPYEALGDSNNRYVSYLYKRPQTGTLFPHDNHGNRVSSTNGVKYPRVNSVVTKTS